MSLIKQIISLLTALWDAYRAYLSARDAAKLADANAGRERREQAIEDLKKAVTEEEIRDAQKRIVDNKP